MIIMRLHRYAEIVDDAPASQSHQTGIVNNFIMENPAETTNTGIECLRGIAITFCRDINFDTLLNSDLIKRYAESIREP